MKISKVTDYAALSRNRHIILSPTHRRAIKEESKVANRDLVDHKECSLLQWAIHNGANWLKKIKTKLKQYRMGLGKKNEWG